MERRLNSLFVSLALMLCGESYAATSAAAAPPAAGNVAVAYNLTLNNLGTRLFFPKITSKVLNDGYSATLMVRFRNQFNFDLRNFAVALNGNLPCNGAVSFSRWLRQADGSWWLQVDVGKMYFESGRQHGRVTFANVAQNIQNNGGQINFWIRGPFSVASAQLQFIVAPPVPVYPRVAWDNISPADWFINVSDVQFKFHADHPDATLECSVNLAAYAPCVSPVRVHFQNGWHAFRVRAVSAAPALVRGPYLVHQVFVWAPVPPVVVGTAKPPESPTSSDSMDLAFTVNSLLAGTPTSAECRIDAGVYKACSASVHYDGLAAGHHQIDIRRVSGIAWFKSYSSPVSYAWDIARTAPVLTWMQTPKLISNVTVATFTFQSTSTANYSCVIDASAPHDCTSPFTSEALADGAHELTITGKDSNGNKSLPLDFKWTVDTTAPVLAFTGIVPQQNPTNVASLNASFAASEPATLNCSFDGQAVNVCASPIRLTAVADGNHNLQITATDDAGNVSPVLSYAWSVDTTLPTLTVQMISPTSLPTNSPNANFQFISSKQASFACMLDNGPASACGPELNLNSLVDGSHTLSVVPTDAVGNVGAAQTFTWVVDLTPPTVTLGAVTPAENPTASTSLSLAFDVSEIGTTFCNLDGAGKQACRSPYLVNSLADGLHRVVISALDTAGNASADVEYDWTVSTNALVTLTQITPTDALTNQRTIRFDFASVDSTQFTCAIDGGAPASCTTPATYQNLADGQHTFEVRGLNAIGNPGTPADYGWTVDATAPVVTLGTPTPSYSPTSIVTLSLPFASNETSTFRCSLDSAASAACTSPFLATNLVTGTHTISIVATDAAGNGSAPVVYTWAVDTSAFVSQNTSATNVTTTGATIGWTSNLPGSSAVQYSVGTTVATNVANAAQVAVTVPVQTPTDPILTTTHSVNLTGLASFTLYTVRGVSVDRDGRTSTSEPVTFRTPR